jgi:hypothetical protein
LGKPRHVTAGSPDEISSVQGFGEGLCVERKDRQQHKNENEKAGDEPKQNQARQLVVILDFLPRVYPPRPFHGWN